MFSLVILVIILLGSINTPAPAQVKEEWNGDQKRYPENSQNFISNATSKEQSQNASNIGNIGERIDWNQKKPYTCQVCGIGYKQKHNLEKHTALVHEKKNPYNCEICDFTFACKWNLKEHITSVHGAKKSVKSNNWESGFSHKVKKVSTVVEFLAQRYLIVKTNEFESNRKCQNSFFSQIMF